MIAKFFDHLLGANVVMNFDFGRAVRLRHEAELLATPQPVVGDDWTCAAPSDSAPEAELPEGVSESGGRFFANCCCCERECDVTEFIADADIDFTGWYGGCGPACCP